MDLKALPETSNRRLKLPSRCSSISQIHERPGCFRALRSEFFLADCQGPFKQRNSVCRPPLPRVQLGNLDQRFHEARIVSTHQFFFEFQRLVESLNCSVELKTSRIAEAQSPIEICLHL